MKSHISAISPHTVYDNLLVILLAGQVESGLRVSQVVPHGAPAARTRIELVHVASRGEGG